MSILDWLTCPSNLKVARQQLLVNSSQLEKLQSVWGIATARIKELEIVVKVLECQKTELQKAIETMRVPAPTDIRMFKTADVATLLHQEKLDPNFRWDWEAWDLDYPVCSWADWDTFITHDDTQQFKYDSQKFDCNRFASVYFGRALAWGGSLLLTWGVTVNYQVGHMWDSLLGHEVGVLGLRHFEPQRDIYWKPSEKSWLLFRAYG